MRLSAQFLRLLAILFLTGALVGFPVLSGEVLARGGGGGGPWRRRWLSWGRR